MGGFIGFTKSPPRTPLSGGHGNGVNWRATGPGSKTVTGSVPDNTHGANDGALNGARGEVKKVILNHNEAIMEVVKEVGRMPPASMPDKLLEGEFRKEDKQEM